MSFLKCIYSAVCLSLISGCSAGIKKIQETESLDNLADNEAIAILKLSSNNIRNPNSKTSITFSKRGVTKNGIHQQQLLLWKEKSSSTVYTDKEYAVFKIQLSTPKKTVALVNIAEEDPLTKEWNSWFTRYCGGNVMVTNVQKQGIHYLGELSFDKHVLPTGEVKELFDVNKSLDGVAVFLKQHYPTIPTGNIKLSPLRDTFDHTRCAPETTVIYI
ncbi:hypothetical protein J8L98_10780 [Pseudoalteromonas sp. MMG013]|uniref:hypothetical protein n=1 Tax=Pseudoalteromonas sp. MMG013 TaxID=2822687 RepID=UPI001B396C18|nr:hypothetical protein [Pseudoalteromonas sp. MMG013]MBQ4862172.1 hypothetical protein [Pseudoalteromonas sp. MMG013]